MNEEKLQEVQPLITGGELLVPYCGDLKTQSFSIEKIQDILNFEEDVSGKLNDIVLSFAQIMSKLMENQIDGDVSEFQGYFPNPESLYLLSLIAEAFKE